MAGHKKKKRTYLDLRDKRYKNCPNKSRKRKLDSHFSAKENKDFRRFGG